MEPEEPETSDRAAFATMETARCAARASRESPATIEVVMTGVADVEVRGELDAFVSAVHAEASLGVECVVMDLRSLEFMNSSCFKSLVIWLAKVMDLPGERRYRFHYRSNPDLRWQRRSLAALSCFATDLVTIEG